jgi:hypothetical protein
MTGNTDMHLVTDAPKKGRSLDQKASQYLVKPQFPSCSATSLHCIDLIRLLIVACGMLSHSSTNMPCLVSMQSTEEMGHF